MIISAKIARYLLILSLIVVLASLLPQFYAKLFYKSIPKPNVFFSSITNEFLVTQFKFGKLYRTDSKGNELNRDEFEKLTPLFSFRQLLFRDEMPDTIKGVPIDIKELRLNGIYFAIRPSKIFSYKILINPLLESQPNRPNLKMPDEFFRIDDEFQFIHSATNSVLPELSKLFNDELIKNEFNFPAKKIFGNPTTKKPFDEGYFIVDSMGGLFHLKRVNNKPYVERISFPSDIKIQHIYVREMKIREFYALIISEDSRLFLISFDNYKIIELPSDGYNLLNSKLVFKGNLLHREISFNRKNSIKVIVTDRNYKVIDSYFQKWESNEESSVGLISKHIFPFKIAFQDRNNPFINFYITASNWQYLWGNLIASVIIFVLYSTKLKRKGITKFIDLGIVLVTGLYGLIALLLIRD